MDKLEQLCAADLVPCPKCCRKWRPYLAEGNRKTLSGFYVWCSECGIQGPLFVYDPIIQSGKQLAKDKAIERWNHRTGQLVEVQADDAMVERVARAIAGEVFHDEPEQVNQMWPDWIGTAKAAIAALSAKGTGDE